MDSTKIKLTADQLKTIRYIEAGVSGGGNLDRQYADAGKEWIENELYVRGSIDVDRESVEELAESLEISQELAALHAAVDLLSCEFDDTQEWVPDSVCFAPVVK